MGIGTSQGAFYEDSFHQAAAQWDPKYDENELTPNQVETNKQLNNVEMIELGGIEVKDQMPFPNNINPDTNFTNRFGNLPPSGVLNDLKKPTDPSPQLVRKISDVQDKTSPFTPLTDEQHKALMWDTPVVKGADPEINNAPWLKDEEKLSPQQLFDNVDSYLRKEPKGAIRGWHDIDGFQEYLNKLPDDVDAHDMKDGTTIFKLKDKAYTSENKSGLPIVKVANVTNTPGEIMDGLEGSRSYPSGFSKPERIKSAALIHNGETYEDINHGMALNTILDKYPNAGMKDIKDGFTTTHGRFVSREEAMGIAQGQRQINHPDIQNYGMLLSEDLIQ